MLALTLASLVKTRIKEVEDVRTAAETKISLQKLIQLCGSISVLLSFHVGHVVLKLSSIDSLNWHE